MRLQAPNPLPATFIRGGTSKGIFINRRYLPSTITLAEQNALFLRVMGSPDPRQLNGMGGGVSSLSKVILVGPPSSSSLLSPVPKGIDVEYTFAQVGIRDEQVDYSGNCGNLSSMVGVFAVDEGICVPTAVGGDTRAAAVRAWNTNTNKEVRTMFPVGSDMKPVLELEQVRMAGVPGMASRIVMEFVDPAGARTGKLLPTGSPTDTGTGTPGGPVQYTLIDATNPTIFVPSSALFNTPHLPGNDAYTSPTLLARLENIRKAGARAMGLDPASQAQPKIAVVGHPHPHASIDADADADVDVAVQALSMGVLHRAVPMTVGLCLGVAASVPGTVVHAIVHSKHAKQQQERGMVRLRHPSGVVDVGAEFVDGIVKSASVVRTGRRLMRGEVWW